MSLDGLPATAENPETSLVVEAGDLSVLFHDNTDSPRTLSGLQSLFNRQDSPDFDAFDPGSRGSSAGLNFEHIISSHQDPANKFAPRHGRYALHTLDVADR